MLGVKRRKVRRAERPQAKRRQPGLVLQVLSYPYKKLFFRMSCFIFFSFLIGTFIFIYQHIFFPITDIRVIDNGHFLDTFAVEKSISSDVRTGFFKIRLGEVRTDLLTLPWIKEAQISRAWPHTITINIEERTPIAIWEGHGFIDTSGEVFILKNTQNQLPRFHVSSETLPAVIAAYPTFNHILAPISLSVRTIQVSTYGAWTMTLSNGLVIRLGNELFNKRLQRFVKIYDTIFEAPHKRADYVDMRYSNAMAVHWREFDDGKAST